LFAAYYDDYVKDYSFPTTEEQSIEFKKEIKVTVRLMKYFKNRGDQAKKEYVNEIKKPKEIRSDQLLEEYRLDLDSLKKKYKNLKIVYFAEFYLHNRFFTNRRMDWPKKKRVEVKSENMYSTESMQKEINE